MCTSAMSHVTDAASFSKLSYPWTCFRWIVVYKLMMFDWLLPMSTVNRVLHCFIRNNLNYRTNFIRGMRFGRPVFIHRFSTTANPNRKWMKEDWNVGALELMGFENDIKL